MRDKPQYKMEKTHKPATGVEQNKNGEMLIITLDSDQGECGCQAFNLTQSKFTQGLYIQDKKLVEMPHHICKIGRKLHYFNKRNRQA